MWPAGAGSGGEVAEGGGVEGVPAELVVEVTARVQGGEADEGGVWDKG